MSLIQSARLNGHNPYAYLKDVLTLLPTQRASERNRSVAAAKMATCLVEQGVLAAHSYERVVHSHQLIKTRVDFPKQRKSTCRPAWLKRI
ncbi:hypothetical protein D3C76_1540650 [compost metagenome]